MGTSTSGLGPSPNHSGPTRTIANAGDGRHRPPAREGSPPHVDNRVDAAAMIQRVVPCGERAVSLPVRPLGYKGRLADAALDGPATEVSAHLAGDRPIASRMSPVMTPRSAGHRMSGWSWLLNAIRCATWLR